MKRTLITLALVIVGVTMILYVPPFIIYGIAGWQLGTWCNYISNKITETDDDIY